jgi:hypothetical protein
VIRLDESLPSSEETPTPHLKSTGTTILTLIQYEPKSWAPFSFVTLTLQCTHTIPPSPPSHRLPPTPTCIHTELNGMIQVLEQLSISFLVVVEQTEKLMSIEYYSEIQEKIVVLDSASLSWN